MGGENGAAEPEHPADQFYQMRRRLGDRGDRRIDLPQALLHSIERLFLFNKPRVYGLAHAANRLGVDARVVKSYGRQLLLVLNLMRHLGQLVRPDFDDLASH